MRAIKFRLFFNGKLFNHAVPLMDGGFAFEHAGKMFTTHSHEAELIQFTGLHDKNGKEIYEGDFLRFIKWSRVANDKGVYLIKSIQDFFIDLGLCVYEHGENWASENLEIIGNKFQNPELWETIK